MFNIIPIPNLAVWLGVSAEVLYGALAYSFSFIFSPTFKSCGKMVKCGIIRIE